jgi:hypothetical protein
MKYARIIIILNIVLLSVVATAFALDDTPVNRTKEAERYLKATPPEEMMKDVADNMAMNISPESRTEFKDLMTKHLDLTAITKAIKGAMVKNFTADELKALADFYSSPVGKAAMKKYGSYMADIMPTIQAEVLKAQGEAIKAQSEANRQKQDENK